MRAVLDAPRHIRNPYMSEKTTSATPLNWSIEEAAQRLGISRAGFYNLLSLKQIRSIKIGARRLIPETELQSFQARHREAMEALEANA